MLPSPLASTLARPAAAGGRALVGPALRAGAGLLVLACGALSAATTGAAGRSDLSQVAREPRVAERSVRVQEMRRQLLEHQRYWRGNAANSPSPSLRDMPPTGTDSPGTAVTPPVTVVPLGTTRIGTTPLGAAPLGTPPLGTPPLGTPPLVGAPIGTPSLEKAVPEAALPGTLPGTLPGIPIGIAPVAKPAAAPSIGDSRLTDRERDLLRQQLRQLPHFRPSRGNPAGNQ